MLPFPPPHADRRYVAWLAVVAVAFNYNMWFIPARLVFPYHNAAANPYWIFFDLLSDLVNLIDIMVWQPRLQFVRGGDIVVRGLMRLVVTMSGCRECQGNDVSPDR